MGSPEGFTFTVRKNGDVVIRHHGQVAATLRGARAAGFVADVVIGDDQELMARRAADGSPYGGRVDTSAEIIASLRRPASLATVGGFAPPADPMTSWLGQVCVLGPDESWPTCDGAPMIGVCQIVVGELPYIPPALSGLALLTLFMRAENGYPDPYDIGDGCWEIRTYADLAAVITVEAPGHSAIRPFPVKWHEVTDDLPAWDDAFRALSHEQIDEIEDDFDDIVAPPVKAFKVGGWPAIIQREISWAGKRHPAEPAYVLQIDSDDNTGIVWGDCGVLYIGRGVADPSTWALSWQCM